MHIELPYLYFINTDSIFSPSGISNRYFLVPSVFDSCTSTMRIFSNTVVCASFSLRVFGRFRISSKLPAPLYIHSKTCRPLKGFSPIPAMKSFISSIVIFFNTGFSIFFFSSVSLSAAYFLQPAVLLL